MLLRLPLLVVAAFVLPSVGAKPAARFFHAPAHGVKAGALLPHDGLPRIPSFRKKRSGNAEIAQVDRRLRDLVMQQESWRARHGTYGREVEKITELSAGDVTADRNVRVTVLYASKAGWSAIASHPMAPGRSCVVYVGNRESFPLLPRSRKDGKPAQMEGIPACDNA